MKFCIFFILVVYLFHFHAIPVTLYSTGHPDNVILADQTPYTPSNSEPGRIPERAGNISIQTGSPSFVFQDVPDLSNGYAGKTLVSENAVITRNETGEGSEEGKWTGIDVSIVGKYAEKYGRPPRAPYINTDQGDLLLFVFTVAGLLGGIVIGYNFRKLFVEGENKNSSQEEGI